MLNALCDLPNGMTCGIDDETHKRHDDCDGDNEHVFQNEAQVKRRRELHDSETEYGGKEGERCLEILARASEEAGSDVTKMMVTSVKRTMMRSFGGAEALQIARDAHNTKTMNSTHRNRIYCHQLHSK